MACEVAIPSRTLGDRTAPEEWGPELSRTRRLLQVGTTPSDTLTPQIDAPAPLSAVSSPCCCVANSTAATGQTCCCGADKVGLPLAAVISMLI